jgi:hypothetical protein
MINQVQNFTYQALGFLPQRICDSGTNQMKIKNISQLELVVSQSIGKEENVILEVSRRNNDDDNTRQIARKQRKKAILGAIKEYYMNKI